jgi:hypothetical protein
MITAPPFHTSGFLFRWIVAGSCAWLLGGLLANPVAHMVSSTIIPAQPMEIDDIFAGLLGILVSTTLIVSLASAVQAVLLRASIPHLRLWIVLSSLGWLCGIGVGLIVEFALSLPILLVMDGIFGSLLSDAFSRGLALLIVSLGIPVVIGAILGAFQPLVLERSLPPTTLWVWASMFGVTVGWLLSALTIQQLTHVPPLSVAWWVISCGVGGGVYSSITGIAVRWLVDWTADEQANVDGLV